MLKQLFLDSIDRCATSYVHFDTGKLNDDCYNKVSTSSNAHAAWEVGEIPGVHGYHLNIRVISADFDYAALEPYIVIPRNPRVVWA